MANGHWGRFSQNWPYYIVICSKDFKNIKQNTKQQVELFTSFVAGSCRSTQSLVLDSTNFPFIKSFVLGTEPMERAPVMHTQDFWETQKNLKVFWMLIYRALTTQTCTISWKRGGNAREFCFIELVAPPSAIFHFYNQVIIRYTCMQQHPAWSKHICQGREWHHTSLFPGGNIRRPKNWLWKYIVKLMLTEKQK